MPYLDGFNLCHTYSLIERINMFEFNKAMGHNFSKKINYKSREDIKTVRFMITQNLVSLFIVHSVNINLI